MKRRTAFFLALLMSVSSIQAYSERNILVGGTTKEQIKESLVLNQAWVPYPAYSDRAGWDKFLGNLKGSYVEMGEKYLDYEWKAVTATDYLEYERSGDRNIMQEPLGSNNAAVAALLIAELAEGKGRFLDQLVNGVFQSCEMTTWSLSAHNNLQKTRRSLPAYDDPVFDLGAGGMGNMLSWTYWFFKDEFDKVDPEISRRLLHELHRKVMDVYLHNDSFWWMARKEKGSFQNNWNPWCNSNALLCFMLVENDRDTLAEAVWKSMESVDQFLNYIKEDGACEEGPSYWSHAAGKLFDYLEMLRAITGGKVDIFDMKMMKDMGEYICNSYVGNGWVVNFADASAKIETSPYTIYSFGKALGSRNMVAFAKEVQDMSGRREDIPGPSQDVYVFLRNISVAQELEAVDSKVVKEPFVWYPQTEFCFMSDEEGLFLAAKGGFNYESHNHNDAGSFILYVDSQPVFIDVGVGTYTRQTFSRERYSIWTMQSNYHNLPMPGGIPEAFGAKYKANDVVAKPGFFSADIAAAFPEEAGVSEWVRSYKLSGKELLIKDSFSLEGNEESSIINFMSWGDIKETVKGRVGISVNGVKVTLVYNPSVFSCSIETVPLTDNRISKVWGDEVYRLSFKALKPSRSGQYKFSVIKTE